MASSNKSKVSLKLLIDRRSQQVLFAEAGKDFVDFLFNFLALPVGTVTRLLSKDTMVGCIGNLYDSVEKLSDTYMQPNQSKDMLLKPKAPLSAPEVPLLVSGDGDGWVSRKIYMCPNYNSHRSWTDNPDTICPMCSLYMDTEVPHVGRPKKTTITSATKVSATSASGGEGGYVKGVVTYMVMDDLVVKPTSTMSCITLFNKLNVKEDGVLEERFVDIGLTEGLELLKVSLQCKTVLTSVFLGKSTVA